MIKIVVLYLAAVNIIAFAAMGMDKYKAKRGLWRLPEKWLFFLAGIGGGLGGIIGMNTFRHKTRNRSFIFGFPAILVLQLAAVLVYLQNFS